MAIKTINDTNLANIANAIRDKNGTSTTYKPSEMANAIANIPTEEDLSAELTAQNITITTQEATINNIEMALQNKSAGSGGITPSGEIEITENGTYDVTDFASALVNIVGSSDNIKFATGTFTTDEDVEQYTFEGLEFTPKLVIVNSGNTGVANVARTCFWLYDEYTNQYLTLCHKSTNASLTTVVTSSYFTKLTNGFTIKEYLTNPIIAGTYTYVAISDE